MQGMIRKAGWVAVVAAAMALTGCISLGAEPPAQLLNLTPANPAPAGSAASGDIDAAVAILDLQTPQKLNVTRVPVVVDGSNLAYLKDAEWVEKPARLFGRLLADTVRAKGSRLVVSGTDLEYAAATKLSGTLAAMDYDSTRGSAIVRFDAVLQTGERQILTRRFESEVTGIAAEPVAVGAALNTAANDVADQVAEWVG
jgi:cholesterol transport system auxiliary component